MTAFAKRRVRNASIAVVLVLAATAFGAMYETAVNQNGFLTGWILLILVLGLALYNVRKRVTTLPIGAAAGWVQVHVYAGLIALFVFFLHIEWRLPDGWFEGLFAVVFLLVALSGVVGTVMNRLLPRRLTRRGEEIMFERIEGYMCQLRDEAESIVLECCADTGSTVVRAFYFERLAPFLAGPRNRFGHLFASNSELFTLLNEMQSLERYLGPKDREYLDNLRVITQRKDDLDFHYALQGALKLWLFVHVPLTVALLIGLALHVVLVYAFSGGLS